MHTIPAAYGVLLLNVVKRLGVGERELLGEQGLSREKLTDPRETLPLDVAVGLYERAVALTGEPALGIYLGLQMRASAHGILGFAVMTARTLKGAIRMTAEYAAIRTTALSLRTQLVDGVGAMVLEEHADLGGAREAYAFAVLVGFWSSAQLLCGRPLDMAFDFAFPKPGYYDRFAPSLPPARFDQPGHQLLLRDLSLLEAPLVMADPAAARMARDQCDQILQSLGLDGRVAPRVRALLARPADGVLALETVARALGLSSRTLRRHLEAEGVTFSALVEDERRRRAFILLRSNELSVQEVGARLGYSDVANFTRAFRRWTGKTPTAFRAEG